MEGIDGGKRGEERKLIAASTGWPYSDLKHVMIAHTEDGIGRLASQDGR